MMTLYVFRERIRSIYQKYELFLDPIIKFIFGVIIFTQINGSIGYDTRLTKIPIVLVLALLSAFLPYQITVLIAAGVTFAHVYNVSKILSIIVLLMVLILYLLFIRLTPRLGIVVLAVPILFLLKIPYVVPLVLGVISTPMATIATACGVFIYYLLAVIKEAATVNVKIELDDVLQLYKYVCDSLLKNKQMFMTMVIFTGVLCITYFIRKLKIDYAYQIGIVAGAVSCILCFLIGDLRLDISKEIVSMILGTIVSALITYIVLFFKQTLDYTAVENTQFEDDDYMYYVKAVPKINVTTPQKNVKHINPQTNSDARYDSDAQNEYEEYYDENDTEEDFEEEFK